MNCFCLHNLSLNINYMTSNICWKFGRARLFGLLAAFVGGVWWTLWNWYSVVRILVIKTLLCDQAVRSSSLWHLSFRRRGLESHCCHGWFAGIMWQSGLCISLQTQKYQVQIPTSERKSWADLPFNHFLTPPRCSGYLALGNLSDGAGMSSKAPAVNPCSRQNTPLGVAKDSG